MHQRAVIGQRVGVGVGIEIWKKFKQEILGIIDFEVIQEQVKIVNKKIIVERVEIGQKTKKDEQRLREIFAGGPMRNAGF